MRYPWANSLATRRQDQTLINYEGTLQSTKVYMRLSALTFSLLLALAVPTLALALPIGYGYNQGSIEFSEIKTDDFIVYHDRRAPNDGQVALRALQAARPHLESWFKVKRSSPLIVNMSAVSDNASFANFITDSIELQTLGQGSRDLAWHEYTHAMMYQHFDNIFGPAGAILHLPWMEAWFLEGLAEAISVSTTSEQQAGVERFQALQNDWPTWDRIHSLYTSGPFSYRGYATSGAFVAWILRTYDAAKLADSLQTLRGDTMPWWWPWALTPFNGFWPMDTMLKNWTGHAGKELYELYKAAATAHWKTKAPHPSLSPKATLSLAIGSASSIISLQGIPHALREEGGKVSLVSVNVKDRVATSWGKAKAPISAGDEFLGTAYAVDGTTEAFATNYWRSANQPKAALSLRTNKRKRTLKRSATWIHKIWLSGDKVWWLEQELESTRLCHVPRSGFPKGKPVCSLETRTPSSLLALGEKSDTSSTRTSEIWISQSTQTMLGDRHKIFRLDTASGSLTEFKWQGGGKPHSVGFAAGELWILTSSRSTRHVRRFDLTGSCKASYPTSDVPVKLVNSGTAYPWVVNWMGENFSLVEMQPDKIPSEPCSPLEDHVSPLLVAIRNHSEGGVSFQTAISDSSIWRDPDPKTIKEVPQAAMDAAVSVDGSSPAPKQDARNSQWRGRPIFAFPWIGADDALGPQLGIVSVPLMDHLQNETVRATALVGVNSRFPYQELSLIETRFEPTWTLSVYRSQTYNGRYLDRATDELFSSYLDEKGVRLDGAYSQSWRRTGVLWDWGARGGHLAPYIGKVSHYGSFNELYAGLGLYWKFADRWQYVISSQNKIAPKAINESFDYTVTGASTSLVRLIGDGSLELGVEGEKTRGPYRRDLQEMYIPLKTFIPGSGGGYNKNSYAFTMDEGLFSPVFGDTQARGKLNFTHPLIDNFDKFMGLIYIDRLDFSAFLNHGTAWRGDKLPEQEYFTTAQGYNVDLLMDNKGVRFNLGLGAGQVVGRPWQVYTTAGFDALF